MFDSLFDSLQALPWLQAVSFTATSKTLLLLSGLFMLWGLIRILRRSKASQKGIKAAVIGLGVCLGTMANLIISSQLAQYPDLIPEREVAVIEFESHSKKTGYHLVKLTPISLSEQRLSERPEWLIEGDEWQITARLLRASGIFSAPDRVRLYRLITGGNVASSKQEPRHAYVLLQRPKPDLWRFLKNKLPWVPGIETRLISSPVMGIDTSKQYRIALTVDGILVREAELD